MNGDPGADILIENHFYEYFMCRNVQLKDSEACISKRKRYTKVIKVFIFKAINHLFFIFT